MEGEMMIAIPNMDKPKRCEECPCNSDGYKCGALDVFTNDVDMLPDCPLIEIVQCKDCKWSKMFSDKQLECTALGLSGLKFPDEFCPYGKRRSNGHI